MLDLRPFQNEVRNGAEALGHDVGEWQIVDSGEGGRDYHLTCVKCGAPYSIKLMTVTQRVPGMAMTMHVVAVGISDIGGGPCPIGLAYN